MVVQKSPLAEHTQRMTSVKRLLVVKRAGVRVRERKERSKEEAKFEKQREKERNCAST